MPTEEWHGCRTTVDLESDQASGKSNLHCLKNFFPLFVVSVGENKGIDRVIHKRRSSRREVRFRIDALDCVGSSEGIGKFPGVVSVKDDRVGGEEGIRFHCGWGVESQLGGEGLGDYSHAIWFRVILIIAHGINR
jgi:hypothetical protein